MPGQRLRNDHTHSAADIIDYAEDPPAPIETGGAVTPAAHVDPPTATPQQIAEALIAAGLMEAS